MFEIRVNKYLEVKFSSYKVRMFAQDPPSTAIMTLHDIESTYTVLLYTSNSIRLHSFDVLFVLLLALMLQAVIELGNMQMMLQIVTVKWKCWQ